MHPDKDPNEQIEKFISDIMKMLGEKNPGEWVTTDMSVKPVQETSPPEEEVVASNKEERLTDGPNIIDEQETVDAVKDLPEQGNLLNTIVDVYSGANRTGRLGIGRVLRDDMDSPFITEVVLVSPPMVKGRKLNNLDEKFHIFKCPSQWTGEVVKRK